jgi:hypothetical protein
MPFSFLSFGRSFDAAFDRAATTELKFLSSCGCSRVRTCEMLFAPGNTHDVWGLRNVSSCRVPCGNADIMLIIRGVGAFAPVGGPAGRIGFAEFAGEHFVSALPRSRLSARHAGSSVRCDVCSVSRQKNLSDVMTMRSMPARPENLLLHKTILRR